MRTCLFLVFFFPLFAQTPSFAPGLHWNESLKSYVGLQNPRTQALLCQVTGYDANGVMVGSVSVSIPARGRLEFAAPELLAAAQVAWVRIDGEFAPPGYVRHMRATGDFSLSPLTRYASREAYLAEPVALNGLAGATTLTMVGQQGGALSLRPASFFYNQQDPQRETLSTQIVANAAVGSQLSFAHGSVYHPLYRRASWDIVESGEGSAMVATQMFGEVNGTGPLATLNLPATSNRNLIFASVFPSYDDRFWQRIVLVNTHNSPLRYRLTAYFGDQEPIFEWRVLKPLEKQVLQFNDPEALPFSGWVDWLKIQTSDAGLAGFQVSGDKAGKFLSTIAAVDYPANILNFPFVKSDKDFQTKLVMVNTQDTTTSCLFEAFDADGMKLKSVSTYIQPRLKNTWTLEALFGHEASSVVTVKATARIGNLSGWASILKRNGSGFAELQGQPESAYLGEIFHASFEHFEVSELLEKEWTPVIFASHPQSLLETKQKSGFQNCIGDRGWPGQREFFLEFSYEPKEGERFLTYQPYEFPYAGRPIEASDTAALLSPYIEIPTWGEFYLSFWARFFDPNRGTPGSHYGMMVREEGADHWYYFGVDGHVFTEHNVGFNDYLIDVYYNCESLPMNYYWVPYQMKLPEEFKGKRIQVAYFYDHRPAGPGQPGPILSLDQVLISAEQIPHAVFMPEDGFDIFQFGALP